MSPRFIVFHLRSISQFATRLAMNSAFAARILLTAGVLQRILCRRARFENRFVARHPHFGFFRDGSAPARFRTYRRVAEAHWPIILDFATLGRARIEEQRRKGVSVVAGVDLGGTAVNYTLLDEQERFLIESMCEHPSLAKQGPEVCLGQIADGLKIAAGKAGVLLADVVAAGLDAPGPASAAGQFSV
jgi:hypothetical protein